MSWDSTGRSGRSAACCRRCCAAARAGCRDVVVPVANAAEARLVPDIRVHAVAHLADLIAAYSARRRAARARRARRRRRRPRRCQAEPPDLADVVGQEEARMALELAAAGGHHLFLLGPPGSGKTMLAERLVSILPRLTREQSIDVLAVRSLLGVTAAELERRGSAAVRRAAPQRHPGGHHRRRQQRRAARARSPRPTTGCSSSTRRPSSGPAALQSLRQPLESGQVVVARARASGAVPGALPAGHGRQPVPVRSGLRQGGRLRVLADGQARLPRPAVRAAARPGRPAGAGARRDPVLARRAGRARAARSWPPGCARRGRRRPQRWSGTPWRVNSEVPGAQPAARAVAAAPSATVDIDRALDRGQLTLRGYDRVLRVGVDRGRPGGPRPSRRATTSARALTPAQPGAGGGMTGAGARSRGERAARVAWARLVEPGDPDVAARIAAVGAEEALHGRRTPTRTLGARMPARLAGPRRRPGPRDRPAARGADRRARRRRVAGRPRRPGRAAVLPLGARPGASRRGWRPGASPSSGRGQPRATASTWPRSSAAGLAERGFAVVSGAAYGIDGAAHEGALAVDGLTVAVVAGGVDRPYPSGHAGLLERIRETGLVVSEVPPGSAPTKWRFLSRNRLIATLTQGTVVVEAGLRSGSRNTARLAEEHLRVVCAVPGPVSSAVSAGCHELIRAGAILVTDAAEVAEAVGPIGELAPAQAGRRARPADDLDARATSRSWRRCRCARRPRR